MRLVETEAMGLIAMSEVRSRGLLGSKAGSDVVLRDGSVKVVARFDKQRSIININYSGKDGEANQEIGVVFRKRKFGMRPYFVCPKSGEDCLNLMMIDEVIASKTFHIYHSRNYGVVSLRTSLIHERERARLRGTDGRRPARGRNKEKLEEANARRLHKSLGKYAHQALQAELARRSKIRADATPPPHPLSSEYALQEGYLAEDYDPCLLQYLEEPPAWCQEVLSPEMTSGSISPKQSIDSVPELDIQMVLAWAMRGKVTGFHPGWSINSTAHQRIFLIVDWRDEAAPLLVMRGVFDPERPRWQRIAIVEQRGRWLFECPVTRRLFRKLYLKDDDFMSRVVGRLYHPSQTAEARRYRRQSSRRE